jgi:trimeric autotransporter adhesin
VPETVETNNTRVAGLVRIGADLTVSLVAPPPAGAGGSVTVADTTRNAGLAAADATSTAFYLSANAVLDPADVLLGSHPVPPLDPAAAYTASTAVQVPASTLTGTYYVLAVADAGSGVAEANEINNTAAAVMRVGPDLVASALAAPSSAVSGAAITVTDTIRNQGGGGASGSATRFYLSTNPTFDTSDTLLASRPVGSLDPGATDSGLIQVTLPAGLTTASFYLIAVADGEAQVTETMEGNNSRAVLVRVTAAP